MTKTSDNLYIKDCPCGVKISEEYILIDSLYPLNRERTKWQLGCAVHNCGCGRYVYGSSVEEVVEKWNNGEIDEYDDGEETWQSYVPLKKE